jgi:erythromycin esterase-like protein
MERTSSTARAQHLTKRLIQEKGFTAVATEADWPDAHRVNRYVLGRSQD